MNHDAFNNLTKSVFVHCTKILTQKSDQYATEQDRFHNFIEGAKILNTTPEKYLMYLVTKHWVALNDFIFSDKMDLIKFEEYQTDIINYMVLLEGLLIDKESGDF